MSDNKIATLMCVYKNDKASHLISAINSILKQSLSSDLYIFVDGPIGPSLKDSLESVAKNPNVFIHFNKANIGLAAGLNFLISSIMPIKYKYIARMDADDISRLDRFERQVKFMDANPEISVSGTYASEFGDPSALSLIKSPLSNDSIARAAIYISPMIHPSVIFRPSVFNDGYRYPENTPLCEDIVFWHTLINSNYIFANQPFVGIDLRVSRETMIRRGGFKKGIKETRFRAKFILDSKQSSFVSWLLLFTKFIYLIIPSFVRRYLYKFRTSL